MPGVAAAGRKIRHRTWAPPILGGKKRLIPRHAVFLSTIAMNSHRPALLRARHRTTTVPGSRGCAGSGDESRPPLPKWGAARRCSARARGRWRLRWLLRCLAQRWRAERGAPPAGPCRHAAVGGCLGTTKRGAVRGGGGAPLVGRTACGPAWRCLGPWMRSGLDGQLSQPYRAATQIFCSVLLNNFQDATTASAAKRPGTRYHGMQPDRAACTPAPWRCRWQWPDAMFGPSV